MALPPEKLKPIAHYVKIANEHATRDPVIHYWCLLYAAQSGLAIDRKSPDCAQYLGSLLAQLELIKKKNAGNEAISTELVAQAHLETQALKMFAWADTQDRVGNFDKNVVKAFYTSGYLFDVLSLFGEIDEQVQGARKYAKWKAAYIHNCLKNGEQPVAGPLVSSEGPEDQFANMGIGQDETGGSGVTIAYQGDNSLLPGAVDTPPRGASPARQPQPAPRGAHAAAAEDAAYNSYEKEKKSGSAHLSQKDLSQAQKYCKYATSALDYEDVKTAVDNLQKALSLLQTGRDN